MDVDCVRGSRKLTALHRAAGRGQHSTVAALISLGSKAINQPDANGQVGVWRGEEEEEEEEEKEVEERMKAKNEKNERRRGRRGRRRRNEGKGR